MAFVKHRLATATDNENLPAVIDDLTEVQIARDLINCWINPARPAMLKGITPTGQPDVDFLARDAGLFGRPGSATGTAASGARIIGTKRPNIVADVASGQNCFQFGYGTGLNTTQSGALATQRFVTMTGTGGYAFAGAFKVPVPGGSNPATTGGWIFGNAKTGFADATAFRIDPANGNAWYTPYGFPGTGYLIDASDYRDGAWHTFLIAYNPTGGVQTLYIDGVSKATSSGVANTTLLEAGNNWGIGSLKSDAIYEPFVGLLGDFMISAIPLNASAWNTERGVIFDYLADKWQA